MPAILTDTEALELFEKSNELAARFAAKVSDGVFPENDLVFDAYHRIHMFNGEGLPLLLAEEDLSDGAKAHLLQIARDTKMTVNEEYKPGIPNALHASLCADIDTLEDFVGKLSEKVTLEDDKDIKSPDAEVTVEVLDGRVKSANAKLKSYFKDIEPAHFPTAARAIYNVLSVYELFRGEALATTEGDSWYSHQAITALFRSIPRQLNPKDTKKTEIDKIYVPHGALSNKKGAYDFDSDFKPGQHELALIPCHVGGNHWTLWILDKSLAPPKAIFYDPFASTHYYNATKSKLESNNIITKFFGDKAKDVKFVSSKEKTQRNGIDCGAWTSSMGLAYAKRFRDGVERDDIDVVIRDDLLEKGKDTDLNALGQVQRQMHQAVLTSRLAPFEQDLGLAEEQLVHLEGQIQEKFEQNDKAERRFKELRTKSSLDDPLVEALRAVDLAYSGDKRDKAVSVYPEIVDLSVAAPDFDLAKFVSGKGGKDGMFIVPIRASFGGEKPHTSCVVINTSIAHNRTELFLFDPSTGLTRPTQDRLFLDTKSPITGKGASFDLECKRFFDYFTEPAKKLPGNLKLVCNADHVRPKQATAFTDNFNVLVDCVGECVEDFYKDKKLSEPQVIVSRLEFAQEKAGHSLYIPKTHPLDRVCDVYGMDKGDKKVVEEVLLLNGFAPGEFEKVKSIYGRVLKSVLPDDVFKLYGNDAKTDLLIGCTRATSVREQQQRDQLVGEVQALETTFKQNINIEYTLPRTARRVSLKTSLSDFEISSVADSVSGYTKYLLHPSLNRGMVQINWDLIKTFDDVKRAHTQVRDFRDGIEAKKRELGASPSPDVTLELGHRITREQFDRIVRIIGDISPHSLADTHYNTHGTSSITITNSDYHKVKAQIDNAIELFNAVVKAEQTEFDISYKGDGLSSSVFSHTNHISFKGAVPYIRQKYIADDLSRSGYSAKGSVGIKWSEIGSLDDLRGAKAALEQYKKALTDTQATNRRAAGLRDTEYELTDYTSKQHNSRAAHDAAIRAARSALGTTALYTQPFNTTSKRTVIRHASDKTAEVKYKLDPVASSYRACLQEAAKPFDMSVKGGRYGELHRFDDVISEMKSSYGWRLDKTKYLKGVNKQGAYGNNYQLEINWSVVHTKEDLDNALIAVKEFKDIVSRKRGHDTATSTLTVVNERVSDAEYRAMERAERDFRKQNSDGSTTGRLKQGPSYSSKVEITIPSSERDTYETFITTAQNCHKLSKEPLNIKRHSGGTLTVLELDDIRRSLSSHQQAIVLGIKSSGAYAVDKVTFDINWNEIRSYDDYCALYDALEACKSSIEYQRQLAKVAADLGTSADDGKTYDLPLYHDLRFGYPDSMQGLAALNAAKAFKQACQLEVGRDYTITFHAQYSGEVSLTCTAVKEGEKVPDAIQQKLQKFADKIRVAHNELSVPCDVSIDGRADIQPRLYDTDTLLAAKQLLPLGERKFVSELFPDDYGLGYIGINLDVIKKPQDLDAAVNAVKSFKTKVHTVQGKNASNGVTEQSRVAGKAVSLFTKDYFKGFSVTERPTESNYHCFKIKADSKELVARNAIFADVGIDFDEKNVATVSPAQALALTNKLDRYKEYAVEHILPLLQNPNPQAGWYAGEIMTEVMGEGLSQLLLMPLDDKYTRSSVLDHVRDPELLKAIRGFAQENGFDEVKEKADLVGRSMIHHRVPHATCSFSALRQMQHGAGMPYQSGGGHTPGWVH